MLLSLTAVGIVNKVRAEDFVKCCHMYGARSGRKLA